MSSAARICHRATANLPDAVREQIPRLARDCNGVSIRICTT
jgi:hypothetical protein